MTLCDVYVVDVCGTLVQDDTTLGLLRHHFGRTTARPWRGKLLRALTAQRSPLRLGFALIEKISGRHVLKHVLVRMLKGDRLDALNGSAVEYASHLLDKRRVPGVWQRLGEPFSSGRVVLASASLEPVVAALAAATGARYVASTLEVRRGVLTGAYAQDLTGCKESALLGKFGAGVLAGQMCAISDNLSDRPLLEKASQACVVLHKPAHRSRWAGMNATFLQVDA